MKIATRGPGHASATTSIELFDAHGGSARRLVRVDFYRREDRRWEYGVRELDGAELLPAGETTYGTRRDAIAAALWTVERGLVATVFGWCIAGAHEVRS